VYASARIPLRTSLYIRAALYGIPISVLLFQVRSLLQALRCQTSPNWNVMRYGNSTKQFPLDHASGGGHVYSITSSMLFWETEETSCRSVSMGALADDMDASGSLALLWPLFISLCTSQFIETLVAALEGRQPISETSLFEQSLAFAEAESLVTKPFELQFAMDPDNSADIEPPLPLKVVKRVMNVTPEVLLISLISALSNLSSNVLAVFGKRKKLRLVNTAVWGCAYMVAFVWSTSRIAMDGDLDSPWPFRFPTIFLIGFIPHLLIILGIVSCASIYGFALLLMILSPPPGQHRPTTLKERFLMAFQNLQANVYLASGESIRFSWEDDFYASLLKAGFTILTCASEAVYLNEGTEVRVGNLTWLEQSRAEELGQTHGLLFQKTRESIPNEIKRKAEYRFDSRDYHNGALVNSVSPYAVERKPKGRDRDNDIIFLNNGVTERQTRAGMALRFMRGLFWLSVGMIFNVGFALCRMVGITHRPIWTQRLFGMPVKRKQVPESDSKTMQFFFFSNDGRLQAASDLNVDVEAEMRRQNGAKGPSAGEQDMDQRLYDWWRLGGWWGEADSSGEYRSPELDDDATSVVSVSASAAGDDVGWTDCDSGRETPTPRNPPPSPYRPENDLMDPMTLASLLDPDTVELQQEARMLARRLRSPGIMTRSQYRRKVGLERANIFISSLAFNPDRRKLADEEEERRLEQFLLERRNAISARHQPPDARGPSATAWATGAPGMGATGPMCVVCQDAPRTILLWPCGCLCLCDECRVSMATRNFSNCVCCRTATEGFGRLFVP
jgi:hypothetical protein